MELHRNKRMIRNLLKEVAPSQAAPAVAGEQVAAGALVAAAATMAGTSLQNRF